MVLKNTSVLSCLLPARFGFGSNHRPDRDPRGQERHAKEFVVHEHPADPDSDHLGGNALHLRPPTGPAFHVSDLPRARANTAPSGSFPAHLPPHSGDIGESPNPLHRPYGSSVRTKRSSFTTFFAFSSKRKSIHGSPVLHLPQLQRDLLVSPQSVPGTWLSDSGHTGVHLLNSSSIPSPLRADDEEYYFSYYASLTPTVPSHLASSHPDAATISPSKQLSLRQQDLIGVPDLNSQPPSLVDSHPSHTLLQHPYAYSTPLYLRPYPQAIDTAPSLRHVASQPLRRYPHHLPSGVNPAPAHGGAPPSQLGHQASRRSYPRLSQPQLKTSVSTPNLSSAAASVAARSISNKRPLTGSKERWLSAETWWDALLSPSPRFKVKQAPPQRTATGRVDHNPTRAPVEGEPNRSLGITFPSAPASRPRAVSVTSNVRPTPHALTRSRSATDLSQSFTSATPRTGFEPALETLVDERTPTPDCVPAGNPELSLPESPISLTQVIDEGMAFEQQRAQWRRQASRSIGNRRTRSLSRARSKSRSEKQVHSHSTPEGSKAQFNLEFLAARSLLGSQSTMPTVHVIRPSDSSSHSKAYSHTYSRSAQSHTHASHSRSYSRSHSHSHSLTASNSSKSSRNPRSHSRSGSWGRTALLKAGAICGISQDEPVDAPADEKVPSSSRIDVQGTIHLSAPTNAGGGPGASKASPPSNVLTDEVGIAITSSSSRVSLDPTAPNHSHMSGYRHQQGDQDKSYSSKHAHWSSAGPHPSAIDSNVPQLGFVSNVSLRHRLPPRATIYPPINPVIHPFGTTSGQPERVGDKTGEVVALKVTQGHVASEPSAESALYPHISLSHADFEQYGVGEALVYASLPRPDGVSEVKTTDMNSDTIVEPHSPDEKLPSCDIIVSQHEESDSVSMAMNNPPSLTSSTIQMVMSAFNNPDDLDEFQDLFYKPRPISGDQRQESIATLDQVPIDVRSSASSSPLTHLVRKLSEEAHSLRDSSRVPSDLIRPQRSESQDHPSNESGTKFVFMDLPRLSASPPSMESPSQIHIPIQGGMESTTQPTTIIPEDIDSSHTISTLESLSTERENDTFGCPIRHGQFEAVTAPSPVQTSIRLSTHPSVQEDEDDADEAAFLSPVTRRYELSTSDGIRSSYVTTSDVSHMSGLLDFPLPPCTRSGTAAGNASLLQAYVEATLSELESDESGGRRGDGPETVRADTHMNGQEDQKSSNDVKETLHALRTFRVASHESQMTFGESNDQEFIAQLRQARP